MDCTSSKSIAQSLFTATPGLTLAITAQIVENDNAGESDISFDLVDITKHKTGLAVRITDVVNRRRSWLVRCKPTDLWSFHIFRQQVAKQCRLLATHWSQSARSAKSRRIFWRLSVRRALEAGAKR